jgi:putative ABC transport system permease protein
VAGVTSQLPLSGDRDEYGTHFEADPTRAAATYSVYRYGISPGYLEALGIPLREGRLFDARDRADSPRVALISESLARSRFPTGSAVGARLRVGPTDGAPYTIVGVVGSVRQLNLAADETDAVYMPSAQWDFLDVVRTVVVRTPGDPRALVTTIRQAIWSVNKDQPIVRVAAMIDIVRATAAERRFVLLLFQGFTLAALVLAAAGIYGLLAGSVAERTREIGVRSALGATRRAILSLVVGEGASLTAVGAAAGLSMAVLSTRFIGGLLFDVSRFDPWTYFLAVGVLASAAMIACIVPAWRAVHIDPAVTLRAE